MRLSLELPPERGYVNLPKLEHLRRRAAHLCGEWGCILRSCSCQPEGSIMLLEARPGTSADQLSTCFDEINFALAGLFDEFGVGCESNF